MLSLLGLTGCAMAQAEPLPYVDLSQRQLLPTTPSVQVTPLHVAVASVISPQGAVESYQPLLDYLSRQLNRPVELVQRRTYADINDLIERGEIDLAFVCTSAYVIGHRKFGMDLRAAPQVAAHTFTGGFPASLLAVNTVAATERYHLQQIVTAEGLIWDIAVPIFEGRAGAARLGLAEARVQVVVNAVTGQMLLTILVVALGGIAAASLLTWLLTRPILELVATTRRVGQGDLTARAPHWANDEIGTLADAFNQMVSDLETSRQAIAEKEVARSRLLAQLISAQEEERRRIARELHDGVGQALTSLMVGLKLVNRLDDRQALAAKTAELRQVAGETLDEVRLLSRQLRPSVLDDLGLAAALERYTAEFAGRHPDLIVDFHCDLPQRLPLPVETSLYRIVQEAMTNAARHSQASTLSVVLTSRQERVQAIIEDNGCGFDAEVARRAGDSVGLHSMAERAELLGGALKIESSNEGTTVYVETPL